MHANRDGSVSGIIVYYPVFGNKQQDQYLQNIIDIAKDVEGLSHRYLFNMYQNIRFLDPDQRRKSILPCTPLAIIKVLEHLEVYNSIHPVGNRLFGRTITVINRSGKVESIVMLSSAVLSQSAFCLLQHDHGTFRSSLGWSD